MLLLRELPGRSLLPRLTLPSPVKGANRKLGSTFEACSHFFARLLLGVIGRGVARRGKQLQMQILFFLSRNVGSSPLMCSVRPTWDSWSRLARNFLGVGGIAQMRSDRSWWWMLIRFVSPSYASCFSRRQRLRVDNFFSVIWKVFLDVNTTFYLVQDESGWPNIDVNNDFQ